MRLLSVLTVFILINICYSKCLFAEKINSPIPKDNTTEYLISLLNKPLSQEQLDDTMKKYRMSKVQWKDFFYESKEFGFLFNAGLFTPMTFRNLVIMVNPPDGNDHLLLGYNKYKGTLPLSIKRDCNPQDIIKRFNLVEYRDIASQSRIDIVYSDRKNKIIYGFTFRNYKILESINIRIDEL